MNSLASALAVTPFVDAGTIRLISTAYIKEPALAPLCDDVEDLAVLTALEGLTSARLSTVALPHGVSPSELLNASFGYGWTYINAAFCHVRPPGNRFNGEDRGAWYCAFGPSAAETCQAEIIFHRTRALREAGSFFDRGAYRQLLAGFVSAFHDLRGHGNEACLDPDPQIAYPAGQALAKSILDGGGNGLIYPSVRHPGGACLAVFRPSLVQNVRQGETILFEWSGAPTPRVIAEA